MLHKLDSYNNFLSEGIDILKSLLKILSRLSIRNALANLPINSPWPRISIILKTTVLLFIRGPRVNNQALTVEGIPKYQINFGLFGNITYVAADAI